ncbi:MAG TPA: NCS2 family permease, partial [Thermoanaerobaculia bacterium]|nr:NCS2 family permease [Thermoanaerobaculia bacterium]
MFHLRENATSVRVEVIGGTTTFLAMAYIIVVNPAILKFAGLPVGASTVATIIVAAAGSILMGVYANRPIAVAPYMGENAFIAFGLAALGVTWQQRLGAVFISGAVFVVITFAGLRAWLANAISPSLKYSFAVGIGLFLAFIGLNETGIVTRAEAVPVQIGNLRSVDSLLAIAGFLL